MIAAPLNDQECLGKVTEVAATGLTRSDVRDLAARFPTTEALIAWIRGMPQRDDNGDPAEGPRVPCDVAQRVRLISTDPNCVERSILYLAAAEHIEPERVRQLATIETQNGRHTFPVEDGEPVVLDPRLTRNGLRAGVWAIRNAGRPVVTVEAMEPHALLSWVADLAEEVAETRDGPKGRARVARSRRIFAALLRGVRVTVDERADALYTLRAAAEAAPLFGEIGAAGLRVARAAVARLVATLGPRPRNAAQRVTIRINPERAAYWTGKTIATFYGLGGLYDPAYQQVTRRPGGGARAPPEPAPMRTAEQEQARPGALPGSLDALAARKER